MENIELLRNVHIFKQLSALELVQVSKLCKHASYDAGEAIIEEGQLGDQMFVVKTGLVRVFKNKQEQSEELCRLQTGEHFGEISLIDSGERSASVVAIEPTTVITIPAKEFNQLLDKDIRLQSRVYKAFLTSLCQRLRSTSDLLLLGDQRGETA